MRITGPLVATLFASLLALPACRSPSAAADDPQADAQDEDRPAGPFPIVAADMPGLPSSHVVGDVIFAGQPTPEGLVNARDSGAQLVINLRPQSEMSFDERSVAQGLGMRYVNLAFTPATLDDVLVESFIFEMKKRKPEDGKLLLHCSSGNRAAALWAMYEIKELKVDPPMAVDRARQLGLTSTELVIYIGDYARRIGAL